MMDVCIYGFEDFFFALFSACAVNLIPIRHRRIFIASWVRGWVCVRAWRCVRQLDEHIIWGGGERVFHSLLADYSNWDNLPNILSALTMQNTPKTWHYLCSNIDSYTWIDNLKCDKFNIRLLNTVAITVESVGACIVWLKLYCILNK